MELILLLLATIFFLSFPLYMDSLLAVSFCPNLICNLSLSLPFQLLMICLFILSTGEKYKDRGNHQGENKRLKRGKSRILELTYISDGEGSGSGTIRSTRKDNQNQRGICDKLA